MSDINFTITTTSKINARSGPGITYEVVGSCGAWEMLTAIGVEQDVAGVNWYKIKENCYVCSKFCDVGISHPTDSKKRDGSSNKRMRFVSTQDDNDISINPRVPNITYSGSGLDIALDSFISSSVAGNTAVATFKRRIFASPYQFLPSTDIRINPDEQESRGDVGRVYASNILREAPILSIMPCKPNYLPSLDQKEKDQIQEALINLVSESVTDLMKGAAQGTIDDMQTKYFSTDVDYVEYMKYVNALCRGASLFMGLGESMVPGTTKKYKEYNWSHWREADEFQGQSYDGTWENAKKTAEGILDRFDYGADKISDIYERNNGSFGDTLRDPEFMELVSTARYYVDFYVTPSTSYSESFSNRTEQSAFANALNKGSDMLKEMTFLMGANALDSAALTSSMASISQNMRKDLERLNNGKDSLFSRLLLDAQTIISGSNIIFPEIWHSSERNQSYRAEIKLISPYGTREAIFLNTLVPMFHILAFTLPRQTGVNSYGSPFLVKAHINKWFSCEMGIIDSCEIQKGGWNVDGFPSEITISISFRDLYSALPLSKVDSLQSAYYFAMNQSLLEYLSVLCGLNLKTSEFMKKFDMLTALLKNTPSDMVENAYAEVQQGVINGISRILGNIGGGKF